MKRLVSLALVSLVAAAVHAGAQSSPSVAGSWDMTTKSPQGERTGLLVIKQEGDKLAGVMKSPRGELPLTSVTLKGSDITLVLTVQFQGSDMVITYTGKVEADKMGGEADFGGLATGEWSAVPHKEAAAAGASAQASGSTPVDVSGVWNATVETPQGTGNPVFTLKQEGEKLTGNYKGTLGEAPLTGTLKGNDITFTFKVNFQGQDFEVTYTGKVEGNSIKGKARLGELGEADWTAKKQ
jgi:hypothetical protein